MTEPDGFSEVTETAMVSVDATAARGCAVEEGLRYLAARWVGQIVWALGRRGQLRFNELRRALPGTVSAKVLSSRLRELARDGLVERRELPTLPVEVCYRLSERGRQVDAMLLGIEAGLTALLPQR